jgi:hypothetical protein
MGSVPYLQRYRRFGRGCRGLGNVLARYGEPHGSLRELRRQRRFYGQGFRHVVRMGADRHGGGFIVGRPSQG